MRRTCRMVRGSVVRYSLATVFGVPPYVSLFSLPSSAMFRRIVVSDSMFRMR